MALVNPALAAQQIEKRLFVNQTSGWLGVVVLDPLGHPVGVNVDPNGSVWLSEAEVLLTARAPQKREHNPFEEQIFIGVNSEGRREEFTMRPLVAADTNEQYKPQQDRYVPPPPGVADVPEAMAPHAAAAAMSDAVATTKAQLSAHEQIMAQYAQPQATQTAGGDPPAPASPAPAPPTSGQVAPTPSPASEQVALTPPPAPSAPSPPVTSPSTTPDPFVSQDPGAEQQSWTEPPPAPLQAIPGELPGADGPLGGQDVSDAPESPPPYMQAPVPPQPPTAPPMTPEEVAGGLPPDGAFEEHASQVDPNVGEETGAAIPPAGEPVQGEYAQAEEIGSPDAPAQQATEPG